MKTTKSFTTVLLIFIVLSFSHLSCRTSEKAAIACPEFSTNKNKKTLNHHKVLSKRRLTAHKINSRNRVSDQLKKKDGVKINKTKYPSGISYPSEIISDIILIDYEKGLIASTDYILDPSTSNFSLPSLMQMNIIEKSKQSVYPQNAKCDTINLNSGVTIIGKVEEIGQSLIKYRKCDYLTGPIISIAMSDVSSIHYSNGSRDFFKQTSTLPPYQTNQPYYDNPVSKTEGLGLAGFIASFAGLFIAGIPLGLLAIIFGGISLSKIKRQPRAYRGKGFAIAAIIIGLIDVIAMVIILAAM